MLYHVVCRGLLWGGLLGILVLSAAGCQTPKPWPYSAFVGPEQPACFPCSLWGGYFPTCWDRWPDDAPTCEPCDGQGAEPKKPKAKAPAGTPFKPEPKAPKPAPAEKSGLEPKPLPVPKPEPPAPKPTPAVTPLPEVKPLPVPKPEPGPSKQSALEPFGPDEVPSPTADEAMPPDTQPTPVLDDMPEPPGDAIEAQDD